MQRSESGRRAALLAALFPIAGLSLLNGLYKEGLLGYGLAWYWAADVVQFVVVPVACAWFVLRPAGVGAVELGLPLKSGRFHAAGPDAGAIVFSAALLVAATWPVFVVTNRMLWQYADVSTVGAAMPTSFAARLLVAIYLAATAAFVEEVAFRALPWMYLQETVGPRWRKALYLWVGPLLFAACHSEQGPAGVIAAAWFGLIAAALYLKLRSLWPVVLGHFATDLLIFGPW